MKKNWRDLFDKEPDRYDRNSSDGKTMYGYDDGEGRTDWYNEYGELDSYSDTPDE